MIDKNKTYQTRSGLPVRIYATDGGGIHHVHGAILEDEKRGTFTWLQDGRTFRDVKHDLDLIEVKPRHKRKIWLVFCKDGRIDAQPVKQTNSMGYLLAQVEIEVEFTEGEGLE